VDVTASGGETVTTIAGLRAHTAGSRTGRRQSPRGGLPRGWTTPHPCALHRGHCGSPSTTSTSSIGKVAPQLTQPHPVDGGTGGSSSVPVRSTPGCCWRASLRNMILSSGSTSSNRTARPMRERSRFGARLAQLLPLRTPGVSRRRLGGDAGQPLSSRCTSPSGSIEMRADAFVPPFVPSVAA
jgi:hypothetical protein